MLASRLRARTLRRSHRIASLTLWLCAATGLAHAATLTGTVRTAAGVAVGNADLDAIDACSGASMFLANDRTAADGTFSITVPNGTYDLHIVPPAGSVVAAGDRQDLVVTGNAALGVFTLRTAALVSGTVRDPLGAAAANVDLKFVDVTAGARVFLTKTVTDALGRWSVRVPPGTWDVDFRPAALSAWGDRERTGLVVGSTDLSGLLDTLRTGVAITGIVRDRNGAAVVNADVSAFDQCTGERVATSHDNTGATGQFSIVVPPGEYTITVDPPACRALESTRLVDRVLVANTDLGVLTLRPGVLVSGIVRDPAGVALAGAKLRFFDNALVGTPRQGTTADRTAADGSFAVRVPNGTYDINVDPPVGRALLVTHLNNVNVNGNQGLGVITTAAGVALTGHVQAPPGVSPQNVNLNVLDHATRVAQRITHDATDAAGDFTVVVAPGTYDVQYDPPVCSGLAPASADSVRVSGALVLSAQPLSLAIHLRGGVHDGAGLPLAGLDLDVFPAGGAHKLYTPGARTAADGSFDVSVPPGRYDIEYLPPAGSRFRPQRIAYGLTNTSLSLPAVVLAAGKLLSGRVLEGATGLPVAGAQVEVFEAGRSTPVWVVHNATDAAGQFSFAVDTARYDLRIDPPATSALVPGWLPGVTVSADLVLPDRLLIPVSAAVAPSAPNALSLSSPEPNPVRGSTRLAFRALGRAELSLWDVQGRRVATLWQGEARGLTTLEWSARDASGRALAPGLYLMRLRDERGGLRLGRISVMQ